MTLHRPAILSNDTSFEAETEQVRIWRSLSSVQIAELVGGAYRAARAMAMAGLRDRHPHLTDEELVPRFALLTLGSDLARRVYPGIDTADRPTQ
jgi:hypothetical protein